ncbi:MAG: hypothetical protein HC869_19160 [Rhodospirillales bacterium]|nr:hypothetical protein [Rhodospirillales bacterium]
MSIIRSARAIAAFVQPLEHTNTPPRRFHIAHEPLEGLHVLDVHFPLSELGVEDNPASRAFFPTGINQYVDLPPYAAYAPQERSVRQH